MAAEKRKQLKLLNEKKQNIEEEISEIYEELMKPVGNDNKPVGVKGNLIDREGFPRPDIDIHGIRILRNRYARLQTDHKMLMKSIEQLLAEVMSLPFEASEASIGEKNLQTQTEKMNELIPILQVETVDKQSPAEVCGLQAGDIILKFGRLLYNKQKSKSEILADVVRVVSQNVDKSMEVVVERNLEELCVELVPSQWEGRGFLGCKLIPL